MKLNYLHLIVIFLLSSSSIFSQLKIDQFGRIGMGTLWPNPGYKCHIAGNLLCTSYPANPYYEVQLKVGGPLGCEIGASNDYLAVYSNNHLGYHSVLASNFIVLSDSTVKSNINLITNSLDRIMKVRAVSYTIDDNKTNEKNGEIILKEKNQFGFLSQQIRDFFPEVDITYTDANGLVLLDYNQIIPIVVSSIQAQQLEIISLKEEISELLNLTKNNNSLGLDKTNSKISENQNVLYQNNPNPFDRTSEIKYSIISRNLRNASIIIFDMNGQLIQSHTIKNSGNGSIQINANEMKPGMYIYSLIVNEQEIDSKRMIILN